MLHAPCVRPCLCASVSLCVRVCVRLCLCLCAEEGSRESVDAGCRRLTASWVREAKLQDPRIETCDFFDAHEKAGHEALLPPGVWQGLAWGMGLTAAVAATVGYEAHGSCGSNSGSDSNFRGCRLSRRRQKLVGAHAAGDPSLPSVSFP